GAGALQIAFEQLKERLQKEGLFEAARKRKLPFLPRRVAVVTSPSGAAVHDFLRVLHRRHPNLAVLIVPARVQGEAAAQEIARVKDELVADLAQRKARLGRAMRAQLERKRGHVDKLRARVADPRRLIGDRKLRLDRARQRLEDLFHDHLASRQQMLRALRERLQAQHPRERLHRLEREVARLEQKLKALAGRALAARRHRYGGLTARLD